MSAADRDGRPVGWADTVEVVYGGERHEGVVRGVCMEHAETGRWDVEVAITVRVPASSTRFLHGPVVTSKPADPDPMEADRPSVEAGPETEHTGDEVQLAEVHAPTEAVEKPGEGDDSGAKGDDSGAGHGEKTTHRRSRKGVK